MYKSILLIIVLATNTAISQNRTPGNFTQGYIVMMSGDTLKGNIALLNDEESCARVDYKKNNLDSVTSFTPDNAKLYKRDNNYYISKKVTDKKNGFAQLAEKGKVNLYKYSYEDVKPAKDQGNKGGPVEMKHNDKAPEKHYDYYLENTNGDFKKISRLNMRGELWTFFKGDDEMVKKVKNTKIEYDEIPALIKDYNTNHQK